MSSSKSAIPANWLSWVLCSTSQAQEAGGRRAIVRNNTQDNQLAGIAGSKLIVSAIVAMSQNNVIGHHNQLPWHFPADLKHFKAITTSHAILMGRKTYESIGRPLPNRLNIILTRDQVFRVPGCVVVASLEKALQCAANRQYHQVFIIGGAQVFSQCLPCVQKLYLTVIHRDFEGDVYFPSLNQAEWEEVSREDCVADEANTSNYSFIELRRRINVS